MERFPKNPRMRKVRGVLYNYAITPHAPTFATLPFQLPPQPSHFQIHTCFYCQPQTRSERWCRRRELETQRSRSPEPTVTTSGCRRTWGRRRSTGWWRRGFFLTASPPDGGQPVVSPSRCGILINTPNARLGEVGLSASGGPTGLSAFPKPVGPVGSPDANRGCCTTVLG